CSNNTFGVMMASPFTVVKGDEFTRLTPAGIIRCLQVQDLLSLRHSIGHRSPFGTRQGGSKSVPYVCCYASPPPTVNYARCKFSSEHTLLSLALVEVQNKGRVWCRQKNVR